MNLKWKVILFSVFALTPLILGWYFFYSDVAAAIAFLYLLLCLCGITFNWPRLEWLGYKDVTQSVEQKKANKVIISHKCNGKKGELEYAEFTAEEISTDKNLSSYQAAKFWVDESTGIVKDIRGSLIHSVVLSAIVFIIVIVLFKKTADVDQNNELIKIITALVTFLINLTYFYSICFYAYKRNIKV